MTEQAEAPKLTRVIKLGSKLELFYSLPPREAVIAAFAQYGGNSQYNIGSGDWNTWDYERRYGHRVMTGKYSVSCGDFAALLPKKEENHA